jgi:hypothetical protein
VSTTTRERRLWYALLQRVYGDDDEQYLEIVDMLDGVAVLSRSSLVREVSSGLWQRRPRLSVQKLIVLVAIGQVLRLAAFRVRPLGRADTLGSSGVVALIMVLVPTLMLLVTLRRQDAWLRRVLIAGLFLVLWLGIAHGPGYPSWLAPTNAVWTPLLMALVLTYRGRGRVVMFGVLSFVVMIQSEVWLLNAFSSPSVVVALRYATKALLDVVLLVTVVTAKWDSIATYLGLAPDEAYGQTCDTDRESTMRFGGTGAKPLPVEAQ